MSRLSAVLKDKSQQCQNEHAKSHQVFEIIVPHRHHLDSLREFRQCHPAVVRVNPIGYASWDTITWRAYANQQRPMDLLLGCARNTVVCIIVSCKQIFSKQDKKLPPSQLLLRRTVVLLC